LIVAGYSLGGLMALKLAEDPPASLLGIAPLAAPGLHPPCWHGLLRSFITQIRLGPRQRAGEGPERK
jgi:esterase/lipase